MPDWGYAVVLGVIEGLAEFIPDCCAGRLELIAIGFVVAFLVALVVIRVMLAVVTRRGFAPFGWLRIAIGLSGLALL